MSWSSERMRNDYYLDMIAKAEEAQKNRSEGTAENCCNTCNWGLPEHGWVHCLCHNEERTLNSVCLDWAPTCLSCKNAKIERGVAVGCTKTTKFEGLKNLGSCRNWDPKPIQKPYKEVILDDILDDIQEVIEAVRKNDCDGCDFAHKRLELVQDKLRAIKPKEII